MFEEIKWQQGSTWMVVEILWQLSHMTRGHETQRTRKYAYSTPDTMTSETEHEGNIIYIYIYI